MFGFGVANGPYRGRRVRARSAQVRRQLQSHHNLNLSPTTTAALDSKSRAERRCLYRDQRCGNRTRGLAHIRSQSVKTRFASHAKGHYFADGSTATDFCSELVGERTGLTAEYFSNTNLATLAFARIDTNINFNWGNGSPGADRRTVNFLSVGRARFNRVTRKATRFT